MQKEDEMTKFSVKKPMTVVVAVILILLLGIVSFTKMQTDLLPSIDLPYAIVMTTYMGASPEEVEMTVSKPLEQSMATINHIKSINSVSNENVSMVMLQFSDEVNMDSVTIDIREKLDMLTSAWNNERIGSPTIMKLNPDMLPIMVAAVDIEGMSQVEISQYLNQELMAKLESIEGVASVDAVGMVEENIHVLIRKEKIQNANQRLKEQMLTVLGNVNQETQNPKVQNPEAQSPSLDLNQLITADYVSNILKGQNFSMPAGYLTEEGVDYLVRVGDQLKDTTEIENLVIFNPQIPLVEPITLQDVADVAVVDNAKESYAKVNGNDAVILSMNKQTSYATAEVTELVHKRLEQLQLENPELHVTYLMDQGLYIDMVVDSVLNNLLFGAILAVLILLFFLKDLKPTLIIACSIPISVIFAIVMMYFSGVTLNIISLSGLAVGVGMLVDNSVVVIENIYRLRHKGVSRIKAAVTGASQVAGAIIASTLTTVCVFLPIVFVEGMTRQLFVDMALTIGYSLIASLIVALTLVPMMSSTMLKTIKEKKHPWMDLLIRSYEKVLQICFRWKSLVLLFVVGLLGLSAYLAVSQGTEYMPQMDSTQVSVKLTMPEGASMEETTKVSDEVMNQIRELKGVDTVGGMMSTSMMGQSNANSVSIYVILKEEKSESSQEIAKHIEDIGAGFPCELTATGSSMDMSAMGGSGVTYQIVGDDLSMLRQIATEVAGIVADVKGTTDISSGIKNPDAELKVTVDKSKALENGLTVASVYQALASQLGKESIATTLHWNQKEYEVYVESESKVKWDRTTLENFKLQVKTTEGIEQSVKLSEVATITEGVSLSSIQREGQRRYLSVSASIEDGYNIGLVSKEIEKALEEYQLPSGYEIITAGENENIKEALIELVKMLLLAVAFIYLIMVAQFQSLLSPFIVMFTIPLAFTGGFLGLFLTRNPVSVISMIGFVMLSGIIVNNGIVLVDYINQLRRDGMEKKDALIEAGKTRMRPILMTAVTTILGLSTMALSIGMGSDMVQPIAIVTIGGLLYATITTLFVIPVLYDIFHRKEIRVIEEEELKVFEEL